jgi:hypothetical protein
MLKIMEILVDRDIRDKIFRLYPVHANQPRKSTETALHHINEHIEEAVEQSEDTLGAFLDIERVFDSTLIDITTKAVKWHRFHAGWQKNHSHTCR